MKLRAYISTAIIATVLIVDQIIKIAVKTGMSLHESFDVASWFKIFFVENQGMAFGMTFTGTALLTVFRLVAVGAFIWCLVKCIRQRYPMGFIVCLALIIAGAFGNIIDNCFYGLIFTESVPYEAPATLTAFGEGYGSFLSGRVVDMFYFPLWVWPESWPLVGGTTFFGAVFNFADAAISVGAVAMILFYYRRLAELGESKEKKEEAAAEGEDAAHPEGEEAAHDEEVATSDTEESAADTDEHKTSETSC